MIRLIFSIFLRLLELFIDESIIFSQQTSSCIWWQICPIATQMRNWWGGSWCSAHPFLLSLYSSLSSLPWSGLYTHRGSASAWGLDVYLCELLGPPEIILNLMILRRQLGLMLLPRASESISVWLWAASAVWDDSGPDGLRTSPGPLMNELYQIHHWSSHQIVLSCENVSALV